MSVRYSGLFVCLLVFVYNGVAGPVPFIKKCKPSDTKCIKDSAQAATPIYALGNPELGIGVLDPYVFDKLDVSDSGLNLILTDSKLTGLKGCRIKKVTTDDAQSKLIFKSQCDLNLDGQYEMAGRLLLLPMEGNGAIHVALRKIILNIEGNLEHKTGKDGKDHWHIKSWSHTYELKDKSDIVFENLFPNSEVLGQAARDLVANNGNEIINTVGQPVVKSIVSKLISNINKFFATVPYEDLVDLE